MVEALFYYINISGIIYLGPFFLLFFFYILAKIVYNVMNFLMFRIKALEFVEFIKSLFLILIVTCLIFSIMGILLYLIVANVNVSKMIYFNKLFLDIDKALFGVYLPFWFQSLDNNIKFVFDFLALPIIISYTKLAFLLNLLLAGFLILRPNYFYQAFLGFFICFFISVPIWFCFPALSPFDSYINNVIIMPENSNLDTYISLYNPNKYLNMVFERFSLQNKGNGRSFFAITSMPSMHIAWSVLILYFGYKFKKSFLLFFVPYFILNFIATLYLLQHYVIDIFFGLIVGIISIFLAQKIAKNKIPKSILLLSKELNDDLSKIISIFQKILKQAKSHLNNGFL
jgi:hypothetical protein